MKHIISKIDTLIKNRELFVSIYIETEWYSFYETNFMSITKNLGQVSVFELEIFVGCYLQPGSFYKRGGKMPDGKVVYTENNIPKTWEITYEGTLEELRELHKSKLLAFQSIYSLEVSKKNSKNLYVKITTTEDNVYFTNLQVFKDIVGIQENDFHLLTGAFISPIFHKKGDSAELSGRFVTITQEDKIVATFNIRIDQTIDNHFKLYGNPSMKKIKNTIGLQNFDNDNAGKYQKYNGYNDFDDDTIDNAFEGDPSATWNVD